MVRLLFWQLNDVAVYYNNQSFYLIGVGAFIIHCLLSNFDEEAFGYLFFFVSFFCVWIQKKKRKYSKGVENIEVGYWNLKKGHRKKGVWCFCGKFAWLFFLYFKITKDNSEDFFFVHSDFFLLRIFFTIYFILFC